MKILIGGDVYCFSSKKDIPKVLLSDKLLKKIKTTDYFIVNLEGPITNSNNKNEKIGIHLKNPIKLAEALKRIKVNVVGIANNHIMDFGLEGLKETISLCDANQIISVGAGENLDLSRKHITLKNVLGETLIVIAMCEDEFCWAQENRAGTNPLDPILFYYNYKDLIKNSDNSIVLIHGGKEFIKIPSPRMRKISKFLVDLGVDLVVWQHSHCIGKYEYYKESLIFYGQGNFLFNYPKQTADFYEGALIEFTKQKNKKKFDIIFIKQNLEYFGAREVKINKERFELPKTKTDEYIKNEWESICKFYKPFYLKELLKIKTNSNNINYDREDILKLHNLLKTESNYEVILTILDNLI